MNSTKLLGSVLLLAAAQNAGIAAAQELQTVVVTATRVPQSSFDLPVSISSIGSDVLQSGRQEVNLSESLARVPGLVAQNRQNYAQDLQISIRGFGARSTFGVRGVRLYADGIPATLPDGQGQVSHFDLGSAGKVEILRGPFSSLYGNSSGGVIALFTEDGQPGSVLTGTASGASFDAQRYALKAAGEVMFQLGNWLEVCDQKTVARFLALYATNLETVMKSAAFRRDPYAEYGKESLLPLGRRAWDFEVYLTTTGLAVHASKFSSHMGGTACGRRAPSSRWSSPIVTSSLS